MRHLIQPSHCPNDITNMLGKVTRRPHAQTQQSIQTGRWWHLDALLLWLITQTEAINSTRGFTYRSPSHEDMPSPSPKCQHFSLIPPLRPRSEDERQIKQQDVLFWQYDRYDLRGFVPPLMHYPPPCWFCRASARQQRWIMRWPFHWRGLAWPVLDTERLNAVCRNNTGPVITSCCFPPFTLASLMGFSSIVKSIFFYLQASANHFVTLVTKKQRGG